MHHWQGAAVKVSLLRDTGPRWPSTKERTALDDPSQDITWQCPVGQWMGHASDCVKSIATMSGRMTLCITEPTIAERSELSTSRMNTAENALRSV